MALIASCTILSLPPCLTACATLLVSFLVASLLFPFLPFISSLFLSLLLPPTSPCNTHGLFSRSRFVGLLLLVSRWYSSTAAALETLYLLKLTDRLLKHNLRHIVLHAFHPNQQPGRPRRAHTFTRMLPAAKATASMAVQVRPSCPSTNSNSG